MNEFFKVKVAYQVESESGVSQNKKEEFLVEAVNYQDAEKTALEITQYYLLNDYGDTSWEITKMKTPELCIQDGKHVDKEGINSLNVVSTIKDDFALKDEQNGLYKVQFSYLSLEDKKQSEAIHMYVDSFYDIFKLMKRLSEKYYGGSNVVIDSVKKEKMNTLIILDETYETATEFYSNIKD